MSAAIFNEPPRFNRADREWLQEIGIDAETTTARPGADTSQAGPTTTPDMEG